MPCPRLAVSALLLVAAPAGRAAAQPAAEELFEKHVRPVLVEKCLPCHGADKAKGGLRLDTRANLILDRIPCAIQCPGCVELACRR